MHIFSLFEIRKNLNYVKKKAVGSQKIAKISYNEEMNLISTIYLGKKRCKK